jgi:hypothetical protein
VTSHSTHHGRVPAARYDNIVVTETADEVLAYETDRHHIHHLNATTAAVWRQCDGRRDVGEIARLAGESLGAPVDEATVRLAVTKLDEAGLLVEPLAADLRVSRMNRRTFMQRAGVAGAIAVPAIVSVTAPAAAQNASTGCGVGCTPFTAQCFFAGYECWACFPTGLTSGYCIDPFGGSTSFARASAPTEEQALALERQYLIDEGYVENDEESSTGGEGEMNANRAGGGATEEATDVPTEEATDVSTEESTEEATGESTEEATEEGGEPETNSVEGDEVEGTEEATEEPGA